MKILLPTTAFPRFEKDYVAEFIIDNIKRINAEFLAIAPRDLMSKQYENITNNIAINRFYYFLPKYQKLAYGGGIGINLEKNYMAKLQIPFLGLSFVNAISKRLDNIDLIHAQMVFAGYCSHLARKINNRKIPLIVSFFGRDILNCEQNLNIYKGMLKEADLFLALSKNMSDRLIKMGCSPEKVKIHHLGIDTKNFEYKTPSKSKTKIRFLNVSRFLEKKGLDYAIKAFAKVVEKYPDCTLTLVGDGPEKEKYISLIKEFKIEDKVFFINNMIAPKPREVTLFEFKKADIFLLPSISTKNDYGGAPVTLVESQSMGVPCIVFDEAGNSEIVLDGKTGFVIPQRDTQGLTNKMFELIKNPSLRLKFSKAGKDYVNKEFNQEIQNIRLENIYKEAIKNYKR